MVAVVFCRPNNPPGQPPRHRPRRRACPSDRTSAERLPSLPVGRRRLIDPDELLDPPQVAAYIGLSSADSLATYLSRYTDFPPPWIERGRYIKLWLPADIDAWLKRHPRRGRKRPT